MVYFAGSLRCACTVYSVWTCTSDIAHMRPCDVFCVKISSKMMMFGVCFIFLVSNNIINEKSDHFVKIIYRYGFFFTCKIQTTSLVSLTLFRVFNIILFYFIYLLLWDMTIWFSRLLSYVYFWPHCVWIIPTHRFIENNKNEKHFSWKYHRLPN